MEQATATWTMESMADLIHLKIHPNFLFKIHARSWDFFQMKYITFPFICSHFVCCFFLTMQQYFPLWWINIQFNSISVFSIFIYYLGTFLLINISSQIKLNSLLIQFFQKSKNLKFRAVCFQCQCLFHSVLYIRHITH